MIKNILIIVTILLTSCNNSSNENIQFKMPIIEIWGDKNVGYTVFVKKQIGKEIKEFTKWSDIASDTGSMKIEAIHWYNK